MPYQFGAYTFYNLTEEGHTHYKLDKLFEFLFKEQEIPTLVTLIHLPVLY